MLNLMIERIMIEKIITEQEHKVHRVPQDLLEQQVLKAHKVKQVPIALYQVHKVNQELLNSLMAQMFI